MDRDRGRKLIKAFLGNGSSGFMGEKTAMDQPAVPVRVLPLYPMMEHLLTLEEEVWFDYAWSREPLEGKFSREQKMAYAKRAAECGRSEAEALLGRVRAGGADAGAGSDGMKAGASAPGAGPDGTKTGASAPGASPGGTKTGASVPGAGPGGTKTGASAPDDGLSGTRLWDLAGAMGLKISTPRIPNGGGHVIFAQYQEPDAITIFMDSADKARALIEEESLSLLLGDRAAEDVLLAHELFHVVEYRKRDSIYTQTEKVELWRKPFSNRSRLICLGEIAGMEFARRLTGLSYTPYVLDVLMMYGYDKGAATALYEEIAAFAGDGGGKEQ